MIKDSVTMEEVIEVLNRAIRASPEAMNDLAETRVICTEQLADDESIQVICTDGVYSVGIIDIINGLFGVEEVGTDKIPKGYGSIMSYYNENKLVEFAPTNIKLPIPK